MLALTNHLAESEAAALAGQAYQFLLQTPELTESEQAELFGLYVESGSAEWHGLNAGEFDFGAFSRNLQQGISVFQRGAQMVGGLAGALGGNNRTARGISRWANLLGQGSGQVNQLFQAFQQRRIPGAGNTRFAQRRTPARSRRRRPPTSRPPTTRQRAARPQRPRRSAPRPQAPARSRQASPTINANALLGVIMNNPRLLQVIRNAVAGGNRQLRVRVPNGESVSVPVAAVLNTVRYLSEQAILELNEISDPDAPEVPDYLLGSDGEYIVDPVNPDERAALVLHLLRLEGEADRYNDNFLPEHYQGMSESDIWALEAGFER